MTKNQEPQPDLVTVSFRFAPYQVQQLALLSRFHGSKTRTVIVALDRLYQHMMDTNAAFAELAAAGNEPTTPQDDQPAD